MDQVKEAFSKVKQDIFALGNEISQLKLGLQDLKSELKIINKFLLDLKPKLDNLDKINEKPKEIDKNPIQTHPNEIPTIRQITQTNKDIPTDKLLSQVLKRQKINVSIGNDGVPTDRQTDRQTDKPTFRHINLHIENQEIPQKESRIDHLEQAAEILSSLDSLKKEIRRKFKALTSQEIAVFSLLYSLEEQGEIVDYPLLSSKLNLSEGSIRDYIFKIQKKGIPIIKEKLNNKRVILHISQDLKKIASLDTILKLREL